MVSSRALLRTRAATRLISPGSRALSPLSNSGPAASPCCLRFKSSGSSRQAGGVYLKSVSDVEDAHRSLLESDVHGFLATDATGGSNPKPSAFPQAKPGAVSETMSTGDRFARMNALGNRVTRGLSGIKKLQTKILTLRLQSRALDHAVRSGQWYIPKGTFSNPVMRADEFTFKDGFLRLGPRKVSNIWLRDNCQCSSCMHGDTKQRLLDTFSIPENIAIETFAGSKKNVNITWSDGHHSQYDTGKLITAAFLVDSTVKTRKGFSDRVQTWGSEIAAEKPACDWITSGAENSEIDKAILQILSKIRIWGFCYITKVDATPEATEELLRRIAFIRETHYGGFYDFTADLAKADTAYTNIALPAHTDNTYFSDPAGLQAFHLLSHTEGEGGASLLVDGFKAAETLLEEDKEAYHVLATVNVNAHASGNKGISIQPYRGFPVLEHDVRQGNLLRVRWNTPDRCGLELPMEEVDRWYAAARKFDAILKRKENEYWEQLQPGTVLLFDNWRVLHGRSEFTGKRRICGAYINRDDWVSRWRGLHMAEGESKDSTAS